MKWDEVKTDKDRVRLIKECYQSAEHEMWLKDNIRWLLNYIEKTGGSMVTDEKRILTIERKWLGVDHGCVYQKLWGPDMEFLINYIQDMQLPPTPNKRKIEKLEADVTRLNSSYIRERQQNDELLGELNRMKDKYEPYIPEDEEYEEWKEWTDRKEIDYEQLVDAFIRRSR